ncbi:serine protease [Paenibacillus sp. F4]|uniref:S1 family peptidase n=1 Tax=Paenibacillus sp. F4 TaxID=357385 RepID=UPI000C9F2BD5|nr:serine protease [Paenibacillus sp. F4]PNQ78886.1 serine protease [Paenibacillus sp. F4]
MVKRLLADLPLSEQLMHCTVRIESEDAAGNISEGTGFFYQMLQEDESLQYIVMVTNKHVIEGSEVGRFVLNLADENGNHILGSQEVITLTEFEQRWIKHPEDVDLCMMPLAPIIREGETKGKYYSILTLTRDDIPSDEQICQLNAIEDIIMIGYPNGIWDRFNNFPVMRRGITATHPKYDYNGKQEFLIDAACFPGSSGSPVFIFNEESFIDKEQGLIFRTKIYLMGVLYAGHRYTTTGEVKIEEVPTGLQSISSIFINLGIIIKASNLLVFERILRERNS